MGTFDAGHAVGASPGGLKLVPGSGPLLVSTGAHDGSGSGGPLRVWAKVLMAVRASDIHLGEWLFALTDEEFRNASAAHVALGHRSRELDGGVVTVEAVGPTLVVSHLSEDIARADRLRLRSAESQAYAVAGCPDRLRLVWDLAICGAGPGQSELHSSLEVSGCGGPRLGAGALGPLVRGLRSHVAEETRGFAVDIQAKYSRTSASPVTEHHRVRQRSEQPGAFIDRP
jgi:hypothetical protein